VNPHGPDVLRTLVCDTSGLLALIDVDDPDHLATAAVVQRATGPFVVSPLVIAELDHLLRRRVSIAAARTFADDVATGAYAVAPLTAAEVAACVDLDRRYADLGLGLTDAHLVLLAHANRTDDLLTLDERHLRAVRPVRGKGALRLLPADA
jgi:predicted nucleic acid-binding protein